MQNHTIWDFNKVQAIYETNFFDLAYQAQSVHREHFSKPEIQLSTLCNIKAGACPENCKYCSQSGFYNTGLKKEKLMPVAAVVEEAKKAKEAGATRFCMGAAWRGPPEKAMPEVCDMVEEVKKLGLETCMTLGMLTQEQAKALKTAGLDYYNHNLDTSEKYYSEIVTTRTYQDRLDTLNHVNNAGINVCCGGILGLGETREDRIHLLVTLANLNPYPKSVPLNKLVTIPGTPMEKQVEIDHFEFLRTVATARIIMPKSMIRLSAGRDSMSEEMQTLCFMLGANSVFYTDKMLTVSNPEAKDDKALMKKLDLQAMPADTSCN